VLEQFQRSRRRDRRRRAERLTSDDLDAAIARATGRRCRAAVTAIAYLERDLNTALKRHSGDTFRDIFWGYYEKTVGAVDTVARAEGWPFLTDLAIAYDHREENELSKKVTGVVANVLARGVVRLG